MKKKLSIKQIFAQTNKLMLILAVMPLIISITLYSRQLFVYQKVLKNIERANQIVVKVDELVLEELWDLVFGIVPVKEHTQKNIIDDLKEDVQHIRGNIQSDQEISSLNVSVSIINTIEDYQKQIIKNIQTGDSVEKNEAIMTEIDSLTRLLTERLKDFVRVEIDVASTRNQEIIQSLVVLSLVELLIISGIIYFVRKNRIFINEQIQKPINELIIMSQELAAGHLLYRIEPSDTIELRQLTISVNKMADDLNRLLEENVLKQYHLAQSEVRVLQAQITPHFIYNSLDAIISLIEQQQYTAASEMTYALSDFFRISLSKGKEWIPVEREIKHVHDYLTILKIRYGETLNFSINIESDLQQFKILKMILQPLVENAVYHGTKFIRRPGKIEIIGTSINDNMQFKIIDNGIGMTFERLSEIRAELEKGIDSDFSTGYGLYNVNKRLLLYYGQDAALQIHSIYKKGTTVSLTVPKMKGEN